MATQSPFSLLEGFLQNFNLPLAPPPWAVDEMHRRTVLLLNHVLMQEPQAMERLVRQKGRVVLTQWRSFTFKLLITPAGLLDLATPEQAAAAVNRAVEAMVRQAPGQYLWGYNRYKQPRRGAPS